MYLLFFKQVLLLSATLPHEILKMSGKFMTAPLRILVNGGEMTTEVNTIEVMLSPNVLFATK